jgi:hypothetical protein
MEASEKVRRVVESMYKNVIGTARLNGKESGQFEMQRGIKLGDSLSLLLFIVYMNHIIEHCKRQFQMQRGIKQGDSLSPLLFIVYINQIIEHCKRRTKSTIVGNWKLRPVSIQAMVYADEVVLITEKEELQTAVIK